MNWQRHCLPPPPEWSSDFSCILKRAEQVILYVIPSAEVMSFITLPVFLMLLFISLTYKLTTRTTLLGVCLRLSVKAVGLTGIVANTVIEGLLNVFVTSSLKRWLSNSIRPISSSTKMPSKFGCNKHQLQWKSCMTKRTSRSNGQKFAETDIQAVLDLQS